MLVAAGGRRLLIAGRLRRVAVAGCLSLSVELASTAGSLSGLATGASTVARLVVRLVALGAARRVRRCVVVVVAAALLNGLAAAFVAELALGVLAANWWATVGGRHVRRLELHRVHALVERLDDVERDVLAISQALGDAVRRLRVHQRCHVHEHVVARVLITTTQIK